MSNRETQSEAGMFGFIKSYQTDMNISQHKWDALYHKNIDCSGAKRPSGCLVCSHDSKSCTLENCAFCQRLNGQQLEDGTIWVYPEK